MNYELATTPELVVLPQVKVVDFEDLYINYEDQGNLGLEDASVVVSKITSPTEPTTYQAVFDTELGPRKLKNLLTYSAPPPPRMLRIPDTFRNFSAPNAMQDMYETFVLEGKPMERGHQLANFEALRRLALPVIKEDPTEPEDIVGDFFTPLYTLDTVEESLLYQRGLSPTILKNILFSNRDPYYRKRLLDHVGLEQRFKIDRVTKEKKIDPLQQERGILKRFEQTPRRLSQLLETFPESDKRQVLEQYAFAQFGGYLNQDGEEETIVFGIGPRQEIPTDTDEILFSMGNLDIAARIDMTLGVHGKTLMIVPTSASLRKYVHAGLSWTVDSLENREWDFQSPLPNRTDPLLGLTLLTYMQDDLRNRLHQNYDLMTPSYAPVLAAINQRSHLEHSFLNAAESLFR